MNKQMAVSFQEDKTQDDSLMQILATRSLSMMLLQSVSTNHCLRKIMNNQEKRKKTCSIPDRDEVLLADRIIPKIT